MAVVKVTRNFQITIPAEVRRKLGVKIGDLLKISIVGEKVIIEKVDEDLPTFELGKPVTEEDVEMALQKGLLGQFGALSGSADR